MAAVDVEGLMLCVVQELWWLSAWGSRWVPGRERRERLSGGTQWRWDQQV